MPSSRHGYLEGLATGLIAGVAGSLVLLRFFCSHRARPNADSVMRGEGKAAPKRVALPFVSRRDSPESAGDPAAMAGIEFNRPGGAPGPGTPAERLSMPGRPGQSIDYGDSSQSVRVARRTLDLGNK